MSDTDLLIQHTDQDEQIQPEKPSYSSLTAFGLCINMIVGTGVFNFPYAFSRAGFLLSGIILIIAAFISWACLLWFIEVLARAEGITTCEAEGVAVVTPKHQITERKFSLNQLVDLFFGFKGKVFSQVILVLYCYGVLWAYGAVFATSVASLFWQLALNSTCNIYEDPAPMCNATYYICLSIFAVIVVPMTCAGIAEQAFVQMLMTLYRFTAFFVMIGTLVYGLATENPFSADGGHIAYTTLFDLSGFAGIFTTAAIALTFHFSVPEIISPMRKKESAALVTSSAMWVAFSFYLGISLLAVLYFGQHAYPLVTLNWQNYTGRDGGWGGDVIGRPWYAYVIQLIVMLFPVFDMLSVFPLVAIALSENIEQFVPVAWAQKSFRNELIGRYGSRLLASVPPLCFAAGLKSLDNIFNFTGLFAFFLTFIFPSALHLTSIAYCQKNWDFGVITSWKTPYTTHFSHKPYAWIVLIVATLSWIFSLSMLIKELVDPTVPNTTLHSFDF